MPKEVMYYYLCQKFKTLPEAGGLLDQDPVILESFLLCMDVESKHAEYVKKKKDKENRKQQKR